MIQKRHIYNYESLQSTAKSLPALSILQQGFMVLACGLGCAVHCILINSLGAMSDMSELDWIQLVPVQLNALSLLVDE